ncbi:hypothetical protein [Paenibacillus sp. MABNR03]|uniref:hypothetical protein n=1 Tax=Paenibacillus sp. MABNR03 TaxID=3142626 RepID=UPI003D26B571
MDASVDRYPIFSFAKVLGKSVNGIYRACPKLDFIQNPYIKAIGYCYLEISELADQVVHEAIKHIDLYEPMIKFLERGGSFTIRQGEMIVGSSAYPLTYWRNLNIPIQDISDVALESVDKEG